MNWKTLALLILPILFGVIIYFPVLSFEFAWLDQYEILDGGLIINSLDEFVSTLLVSDGNYSMYHRPLYNLMHTLDLQLWGENASGFHGTSLLLHGINLILLTTWLIRMNFDKAIVAAIVLSWALLPVNASVVALIHAKGDLLITMFFLFSLNIIEKPNFRGAYVLSGLSLLLALLAKETAIGGLLMIIIWKWDEVKRRKGLAICVALTLLAFLALRISAGVSQGFQTFELVRWLTFPTVYASYFFESIPGLRLTVADSVLAVTSMPLTQVVLTSLMFLSAVTLQVVLWKKVPKTRPFILLFNCMLLPVSQIIPTLHFRADRFLYLASFGWISMFWVAVFNFTKIKWVQTVLVLAVFAYEAFLLIDYLPNFKNNRSLFNHTLDQEPNCREALSFMGLMSMEDKDYDRSKNYFLQALNGNSNLYSFVDRSTAKANLGTIIMREGDYYEALNMFQGVEGGSKKYPNMDLNLAICYKMIGKPRKAFDYLTTYQKTFPEELQGMEKMAEVLIDLGKKQEAVDEFNKILRLYPEHTNKEGIIDAIYMLGG